MNELSTKACIDTLRHAMDHIHSPRCGACKGQAALIQKAIKYLRGHLVVLKAKTPISQHDLVTSRMVEE